MLKTTGSRLFLTRIITVSGLIGAMALTLNLWSGNRYFPLVSLLPLSIPVPFDIILPYLLATFLFLSLIYPSKKFIPVLVAAFMTLLVLFDLSRLQPWYYQYLLTFLILCGSDPDQQLKKLKWLFGFTYFWSGIHKIHPSYFETIAPWLAEGIGFTDGSVGVWIKKVFYLAPFVEILTGLALLLMRPRLWMVIALAGLHLVILWITGPAGHNYNEAIWPWNVVQIILIPVIFRRGDDNPFKEFRKSFSGIAFLILIGLLPLLNLTGKWPSYMSFNLYSGSTGQGYIFLGEDALRFTPAELKKNYLPGTDTTFKVAVAGWSMRELNVPAFPEKISTLKVRERFLSWARDSNDVVMSWHPRIPPWGEVQVEVE